MKFTVQLADKFIEINSIHDELKQFCKDYLAENVSPEFSISMSEKDIMDEQKSSTENTFSLPYLETLALLRKLAEIFPSHNRLLMHGASISYGESAFLFTAPSGTGKSTHIRLWKTYLGEEVKIVNGDKPFISLDDEPFIYGSPWAGKENWQRNCHMPLKAICFVTRGTQNSIRRLEAKDSLALLFKQVYLPSDSLSAGLTLELVDLLLKKIPLYILTCDMSEDAVRCSFETLTGLSYESKKLSSTV